MLLRIGGQVRATRWSKGGGNDVAINNQLTLEDRTQDRTDELGRRMAAILADARRAAGVKGGWLDKDGQVNLNAPPPRNRRAEDVTPQTELAPGEIQRLVREAMERKAREGGGAGP
jgi:hypothetical protein